MLYPNHYDLPKDPLPAETGSKLICMYSKIMLLYYSTPLHIFTHAYDISLVHACSCCMHETQIFNKSDPRVCLLHALCTDINKSGPCVCLLHARCAHTFAAGLPPRIATKYSSIIISENFTCYRKILVMLSCFKEAINQDHIRNFRNTGYRFLTGPGIKFGYR